MPSCMLLHSSMQDTELTILVLFEMASAAIARFASEKTHSIPILLVTKLPWHPHHHLHDAAQPNAT